MCVDAMTVTRTKTKAPKPRHVHQFDRAFPSDDRYQMCACGESRRADRISDNPCVQMWGFGPEGKTCGDCAHLYGMKQARTWYKCQLRADLSHSRKSDQRIRWPACSRFTEGEQSQQGE